MGQAFFCLSTPKIEEGTRALRSSEPRIEEHFEPTFEHTHSSAPWGRDKRGLHRRATNPLHVARSMQLSILLDLCVSSLRRGRANLLCIVQILTDDPRRESQTPYMLPYFVRVQLRTPSIHYTVLYYTILYYSILFSTWPYFSSLSVCSLPV